MQVKTLCPVVGWRSCSKAIKGLASKGKSLLFISFQRKHLFRFSTWFSFIQSAWRFFSFNKVIGKNCRKFPEKKKKNRWSIRKFVFFTADVENFEQRQTTDFIGQNFQTVRSQWQNSKIDAAADLNEKRKEFRFSWQKFDLRSTESIRCDCDPWPKIVNFSEVRCSLESKLNCWTKGEVRPTNWFLRD